MRLIRYSQSFGLELVALLAQGIDRFGPAVIAEKRALVFATIEGFLARHPVRAVDPVLGICAYPVTGAPFVILYDYDEHELRVHLIIHASADRTLIDLPNIEW